MILVIDNYDSFTYNLVQYIGCRQPDIMVRRNDSITIEEIRSFAPERIIISPGPGYPVNAGISIQIVKTLGATIPTLGICLGHQVIAEAYGAEIVRAPEIVHGKVADISHVGSVLFNNIPENFSATRYHSLLVNRSSLPDELSVTAETVDRHIMAIEHRSFPVYGLQFHPESIMTEFGQQMIDNFLRVKPSDSEK